MHISVLNLLLKMELKVCFYIAHNKYVGLHFTGKTLAFGVPALKHILQRDDKKTSKKAVPRCLVLSPTRELAQQVGLVILE